MDCSNSDQSTRAGQGLMLARKDALQTPFNGGTVHHPAPTPLDADMHLNFEVGVVLSGQQERHFEHIVMRMDPGEAWLIAAWEPHGWRATRPHTTEVVLQFVPEFLGDATLQDHSWLTLFSVPPERRPRVTTAKMRRAVLAIGRELSEEMEENQPGWLDAVRLGILRLLLTISRAWQPEHAGLRNARVHSSYVAQIMPAVDLVQSAPDRRVSLREAAAMCGLGPSQFGFVFRHAMGMTFTKFRTRVRLGQAARLLLSTNSSVEDIAQDVGFVDGSHLHRVFMAHYGRTPGDYREEGRRAPQVGE